MKRATPNRAPNHPSNASFSVQPKRPFLNNDVGTAEETKDSFVETFHKTLMLVHSHQKEEEMVFARSLDGGIRSVEFGGSETVSQPGKKAFTVFKITLATATSCWHIYRRYSEFASLAERLGLVFTPPKTFGFASDLNPKFLAKRQLQLEEFLRLALQSHSRSPDMIQFLVARANCPADSDGTGSNRNSSSSGGFYSSALVGDATSSSAARRTSNSSDDSSSSSSALYKAMSMPLPAPITSTTPATTITPTAPPLARSQAFPTPPRQVNPNQPHTSVSEGDFDKLKLLGEGTFGRVFLVRHRRTSGGKLFAMKILEKQHVIGKHQVEHTKTERRVLAKVRHPFIARLHYAFQTPTELYFVIDFCPGGELFGLLQQKGKFPEAHCKFYSAEIALAIGYLHSMGIIYRDLKPENVLLQSSGHIQLVDFGLSKENVTQTSEGGFSLCGTPEYLAPEILTRLGHGKAVDWWSLGSLLFEMLTGLPPWYNKDRRILFHNIKHEPLSLPDDLSEEAKAILQGLLTRDPLQRLGSLGGLDAIKHHPFFLGVDFARCLECKLVPPFVPQLLHEADTSHFDETFTSTDVRLRRPGSSAAPGGDVNTFSGFSYVPATPFSPQLTSVSLRALSPPPPLAFRRLADAAAAVALSSTADSNEGQMRLLAAAATSLSISPPPQLQL
ncbi:hypothetical protein BASA81_004481 [Batrachochytrium salamandrivorans]|nr:hypothetical protein BASA81_004481 [Batrachochytrium salamandrivorans]